MQPCWTRSSWTRPTLSFRWVLVGYNTSYSVQLIQLKHTNPIYDPRALYLFVNNRCLSRFFSLSLSSFCSCGITTSTWPWPSLPRSLYSWRTSQVTNEQKSFTSKYRVCCVSSTGMRLSPHALLLTKIAHPPSPVCMNWIASESVTLGIIMN